MNCTLIYVFGDQWRAQATGYAGDPNVRTPHLDALSERSLRFHTAVANCPVCTPSRASLLTGLYPLSHGLFLNDAPLNPDLPSIGKSLREAGYATAYIGKWHVDGPDRSAFVPPKRRHGFDHWRAWECTHQYNRSPYHADDDPTPRFWEGYDAFAQTREACDLIGRSARGAKPIALFLSWGPPHNPYGTAPEAFRRMYDPATLKLRPNVPEDAEAKAREDLAGYYAHCSALDACVGELMRTLRETGMLDRTLLVFTADHGDMLGSQGRWRKQSPWDESILVPMLVHAPGLFGADVDSRGRDLHAPFGIVDTMPTLLELLGIDVPAGVEGISHAGHWLGGEPVSDAALIASYHVFGEWVKRDGREYRGLRTARHTYVRDLRGPWLLYDNERDPYQMRNLIGEPEWEGVRRRHDGQLSAMLEAHGDEFLPGMRYVERWGYRTDETGTIPYTSFKS